jgi:predicted O-methyltransferase YrrM
MQLVEQHKYQENERILYSYVKSHAPKTIIELGYGSGALSVAMAYAVSEYNGHLHSYDLVSPDLALTRLRDRKLDSYCTITQGNVLSTYLANAFKFDLILIDIDNTWPILYDVIFKNDIVYQSIRSGAHVIIEGGADAHPRINLNTLNTFHKAIGDEIFSIQHISGPRTSLSILTILK